MFLEDASFSTNQFVLKTGTIAGQPAGQDPDLLVLVGNVNANPVVNLFNASFTPDVFHNFGITLDFDAKYVAFSATLSSPGVMVLTLPTAQPQSSTPPTPRPSQLSTAPSRTTSAAKVNTTSAR